MSTFEVILNDMDRDALFFECDDDDLSEEYEPSEFDNDSGEVD